MYDYLGQTFGICGGVMGRISFIALINALLATRKEYRAILWALMAAQIIVNVLFILIIFLQCPGHASAIWSQSEDSGNCWDLRVQTYYGYFEGCKSFCMYCLASSTTWLIFDSCSSIQLGNGSLSCCFFDLCLLALEYEAPSQTRVDRASWSRNLVSH